MKLFIAAAIASLFCGQMAFAEDFSIPVDKNFTESSFDWNGGLGKGYVFRWGATAHNGLVAICGAGQYPDSHTQAATRDIMRKAFVSLNGKVILKDITFFARVPMSTKLESARANCRDTKTKIPKGNWELLLEASGKARF